ncbi:MAG: MDR family MFS transporter [Dehalococcoidia bacterium]
MKRIEYKWLVALVFVFGLFMELLDMTITNVALPTLAREFNATTSGIEWVVTGYLLSLAVFIPISGWAGDRFGTKRTFMFALFVFTVSSTLCALAWSIESLIAFRALQGVGGGMLTPVGTTMLFRAFPPRERARASAVLVLPTVVAPASGPILGGYLVEFHSWHWIFLINIPIGLAGLVVAALALREQREPNPGRLDLLGFLLAAPGLAAVIYALGEAGRRGFADARVLGFGLGGLALLAAFVLVELRAAKPMIDIRLFQNRLFSSSLFAQVVAFAGFSGALFLLPLMLQAERGLGPLQSGLTTFPQAIGVFVMAPLSARLYPKVGPRRMTMAGLFISALTTASFVLVGLETSDWWIRVAMFVRGIGFALVLIPMQTATFATIRAEDTGRASAASNSIRQVASSFGVALLATVLANRLVVHQAQLGNPFTRDGAMLAFHDGFFVATVLTLLGMVAALLIDDRLAAGTMRRGAGVQTGEEELVAASTH